MGMFDAIDASASGMTAERLRMDVTAENLANAETTRTPGGGPYQRKAVVLQQASGSFAGALAGALGPAGGSAAQGVEVAAIVAEPGSVRRVYDPGHPDADGNGYVAMPDINPVTEMVDLIGASRAYQANVTAMQTTKTVFTKTIELLR
jgi:flagellar basal-body rod protein FlgC